MSSIEEGEELEEGEEVSEKEQSSEFIIVKQAGKKQLCEVCQVALRKYICPKCGVKSCGIVCLNRHKKSGNCSGVADPFVSLNTKRIEERAVEKDYLFVKDMLSNADKVKRTMSGVETFDQQPKRFKIMRINAKKLYNIDLLHAPAIIERHRQNISFYFVKTKTFYWVVEVLFWRLDKHTQVCSRFVTQPSPDTLTLQEIMPSDYLCRDLLERGINTQKKEEFSIFMQKREKLSSGKNATYFESSLPLRDCLVNQTIYQYPTLIAVHSSLLAQYKQKRHCQ